MEKREIKIKSYLYLQQNIAIMLFLLFGIPTVVTAIWFRPFSIPAVLSLGIVSIIFLSIVLITRMGCRTYDIYSVDGIKRICGDKTIFEIKWEDVDYLMYYGFKEIIIFSPFVLIVGLQTPLKTNKDRNFDDTIMIKTPISKGNLRRIEELLSFNVNKHIGIKMK